MRVASRFSLVRLMLSLFMMTLQAACTHVYTQPIHSVHLPEVSRKIDVPVELVITDAFREAKWEDHRLGDTFIVPIGDNLVHHTKGLTRNVFVRSYNRDERNVGEAEWPSDRYVLAPKLAFVKQSFGVHAFSEARTSIGIEWELQNSRGEPIWVETVQGEGLGTPGNMYTHKTKGKERFQLALQDLFVKSQEAMLNSEVFRKLH